VKLIVACELPGVAAPIVGASGSVRDVTSTGADAAPVPAAVVAVTVQEYCTPFVRLVTTIGDAPALAIRVVCPAAVQVEVNVSTAEPPLKPGVKAMLADASPGVATNPVGASGVVRGVTAIGVEAALSPAALVATIAQLYATPLVSDMTVTGDAVAVPVRVV